MKETALHYTDIMLVPLVSASVEQHAFLLLLQWFGAVTG